MLLVRTDFTYDEAWDQVQDESTREYGPDGFCACVEPVSYPPMGRRDLGGGQGRGPHGGDDYPALLGEVRQAYRL
jgi:hypothetical protein